MPVANVKILHLEHLQIVKNLNQSQYEVSDIIPPCSSFNVKKSSDVCVYYIHTFWYNNIPAQFCQVTVMSQFAVNL